MAIPAAIAAEVLALQTAFLAATPLAQAPRASVTALQINAAKLVTDIDAALFAAVGPLDNFWPSAMPQDTATNLQWLLSSAQAQSDIAALRGLIGRVASNLMQA